MKNKGKSEFINEIDNISNTRNKYFGLEEDILLKQFIFESYNENL